MTGEVEVAELRRQQSEASSMYYAVVRSRAVHVMM